MTRYCCQVDFICEQLSIYVVETTTRITLPAILLSRLFRVLDDWPVPVPVLTGKQLGKPQADNCEYLFSPSLFTAVILTISHPFPRPPRKMQEQGRWPASPGECR